MTPLDYYHEQCKKGLIIEDKNQLVVMTRLQAIYHDLFNAYQKRNPLFSLLKKQKPIQGIYLWGSVGIGKTFLMDCFYHCIPFQEKQRMHFHQFMQFIHHELKVHQGKKNPLHIIAKNIAKKTKLLCFDEFFVSDIADAIILANLFSALFSQGICLIATSNTKPDELYRNGLQRALFLPAIALLKNYTHVIHIPTTIDYRLRHLQKAGVFYTPNDELAYEKMNENFNLFTENTLVSTEAIEIQGRKINVKKRSDEVIWFDFDMICHVPRSQHDYLAIAKQYKTIFISNIPSIPSHANNSISLFIKLVDILYDAKIRLIFSAEKPIHEIYQQGKMLSDYIRTCSRLTEMQTAYYVSSI